MIWAGSSWTLNTSSTALPLPFPLPFPLLGVDEVIPPNTPAVGVFPPSFDVPSLMSK